MKTFSSFMESKLDKLEIKKQTGDFQKSNRTGSPTVKRSTWLIIRKRDGKILDTASSAKEADRIAKFMPERDL